VAKTGRVQQLNVLGLRPLSTRPPAQHVDIKELREVRITRPGNDVLYDEDAPFGRTLVQIHRTSSEATRDTRPRERGHPRIGALHERENGQRT
jgi:hypothetical protein